MDAKTELNSAGYTLFLALVIDRLHHYLNKMITLRKTASASREEVEGLRRDHLRSKEEEERSINEVRKLEEEVASLNEELRKVSVEFQEKEKRAQDAEAHVASLQNQCEELLLEYDRLLEDNQILQGRVRLSP